MKRIEIFAFGGKKPITENAGMTENFAERFMGLMLKREMDMDALVITPCNSIHMFFMKFSIDAVFLDREGQVVAVEKNLKPWKISGCHKGAHSVVEMPSGAADRLGIHCGATLGFSEAKVSD